MQIADELRKYLVRTEVYDMINNEFILISLYVDDRSDLNQDQIIILTDKNGNEKTLKKVGEKWSAFQTINFKNNSNLIMYCFLLILKFLTNQFSTQILIPIKVGYLKG